MKIKFGIMLVALPALLAVGLLATGCDSDSDDSTTITSPATAPAAIVPSITVVASDYSFDAPETFPAGRVVIDFRNEGTEEHHAQFLRLNDGVTLDQLAAAVSQEAEAAPALTTLAGGPGALSPGGRSSITLDLATGNYVMLCFIPSPDEMPHLAKGMVRPFRVVGDAPAVAAPASDGDVILGDFSIRMPELKAGVRTLSVLNGGPQPHEVVISRLTGEADVDAVQAFLRGEGPPPDSETVGGTTGLANTQRAWVTLDLTPGDYVAVCFVPDPTTGKAHFQLGMATAFSVK